MIFHALARYDDNGDREAVVVYRATRDQTTRQDADAHGEVSMRGKKRRYVSIVDIPKNEADVYRERKSEWVSR